MADPTLVRTLNAALPDSQLPTDVDLLRRYVVAHDQAAFELLVRRHAGLVWKVCRGALGPDRQTAEDAFQASFIVLARKASTVRTNLPGWLYRVARRAATQARRKRPTEGRCDLNQLPGTIDLSSAHDSTALMDEVDRLKSKFRDPVLLCFFEGYTHPEAAAKLGLPVGTLASRLARAKNCLRDRLTRRGVTLSATAFAALTVPTFASDPSLVRATLFSILDPTAVPATVASLSTGVLSAMRLAKLKLLGLATAAVVGLTTLAVTVGTGQEAPKPADPPKPAAADPMASATPEIKATDADKMPAARPEVVAKDSTLRRLQIARFNLALVEHERVVILRQAKAIADQDGWDAVDTLVACAADVFSPADVVAWYAWRVAVAKRMEASAIERAKAQSVSQAEFAAITRRRVEAEIDLLKWKLTRVAAAPDIGREYSKQALQKLDQTWELLMKRIEKGEAESGAYSIAQQVHTNRAAVAHELYGDSADYLKLYESYLTDAEMLHSILKKRFKVGTVRQSELTQAEAHLTLCKRDLQVLKSHLGMK